VRNSHMVGYRHTQVGWAIIISVVAGATLVAASVAPAVSAGGLSVGILVAFAAIAPTLALFGTLTVEVDAARLTLRFGIGIIRKSIALRKVRSYSVVKNRWYQGLGVRILPNGILYNVSGMSAVELVLAGGRRIRIGTDEPKSLVRALRRAVGEPQPLTP